MSYSIVNVVATGDLSQVVSLKEIAELPNTIYDSEIYSGRVAYLKTPKMYGKVTIFPSGKLISVGSKSPEQAKHDLQYTSDYLVKNKLATPVKVKAKICNLVAVTSVSNIPSIETIANAIGAIYEPEQFPGVILKNEETKATYLIFQSGKIVILGTNSITELKKAETIIIRMLSSG